MTKPTPESIIFQLRYMPSPALGEETNINDHDCFDILLSENGSYFLAYLYQQEGTIHRFWSIAEIENYLGMTLQFLDRQPYPITCHPNIEIVKRSAKAKQNYQVIDVTTNHDLSLIFNIPENQMSSNYQYKYIWQEINDGTAQFDKSKT